MSFDNKKWRRFQKNVYLTENNKLEASILNEISIRSYEAIKDWMGGSSAAGPRNEPGESYSFGHMFGETETKDGSWRVSFPLATRAQIIAADMMASLRNSGWYPAFEEKIIKHKYKEEDTGVEREREEVRTDLKVQKETEKVIPKGPRAGETVKRKEQRRISQALNVMARDGEISEQQLEDYLWLLNKKLEYYTKNSDELVKMYTRAADLQQYSVVVTRHPVDIIRMSDFQLIHSCHSEGSSYFDCAMAEAKAHGLLAYVVKTEDLKDVDLDEEEIFVDPNRSVPGIEPVARVRLRRFYNASEEYELALPETRTYGTAPPGLHEFLRGWAMMAQKDYLEKMSSDIKFGEKEDGSLEITDGPDLDDFTRTGGSWSDNEASFLFNKFFETDNYYGDTDSDDEEEENFQEQLLEEMEQTCSDIEAAFHREADHTAVHYEVAAGDFGDGPPYVTYGASMQLEVPLDSHVPHDKEYDIEQAIHQGVDAIFGDVYVESVDIRTWAKPVDDREKGGTYRREHMMVTLYARNDYWDPDPDGFDGFCDALQSGWESEVENAIIQIRDVLIDYKVIEATEYDTFISNVMDDKFEFKHFLTDLEGGKVEVSLSSEGMKYTEVASLDWGGKTRSDFNDIFMQTILTGPHPRASNHALGVHSSLIDKAMAKGLEAEKKKAQEYAERQIEMFPGLFPEKGPEEKSLFPNLKFFFFPRSVMTGGPQVLDVMVNMLFEINRDVGKADMLTALANIKYFDNPRTLGEVTNVAKVIFAERFAKYKTWKKQDDERQLAKKKKRVDYLQKLIRAGAGVTDEDVENALVTSIGGSEFAGEAERARMDRAWRHAAESAEGLKYHLERSKPMRTSTGPRAYAAETSWEDIEDTVLFGREVGAHVSSIKLSLRTLMLNDRIPEVEPEESWLRATFGNPVPAKRDEYKERAEKLMHEVFNI
jgi:hypothetical protein